MKLLTKAIQKSLPPLYATEGQPRKEKKVKVKVKFFLPNSSFTWYAIEASSIDENGKYHSLKELPAERAKDVMFYGIVDGLYPEFGYFLLSELKAVRSARFKLPVERDMYFEATLGEVMDEIGLAYE